MSDNFIKNINLKVIIYLKFFISLNLIKNNVSNKIYHISIKNFINKEHLFLNSLNKYILLTRFDKYLYITLKINII